MKTENYISASCVVSNNVVYKDGLPVFEEKGSDLSEFLIAAYRHFDLQYPKFHKMDNLSKLGWLANEILLQNIFNKEKYKPEEIGIVLSNANASLDTDIKYYETTKTIASPAQFVYTLPNIVIGEISIRHRFKGENAFFISKEFDAGFIEQYVNSLINNDILQCCICGWVDVLGSAYNATLFLIEKDKSANSINFTKENLKKNKPSIIIVFNPGCEHCKHETEEIIKNINDFKNMQIVMTTPQSFTEMKDFYKEYNLSKYPNIIVGRDEHFTMPGFYAIRSLPFIAFYNKKQKLISVHEGSMTIPKMIAEMKKD